MQKSNKFSNIVKKMKEDLKIESFLNRMAEKHKANAMKIKEIKFCHSENLCHFVLLSLNKKQKSEQPMWIARSLCGVKNQVVNMRINDVYRSRLRPIEQPTSKNKQCIKKRIYLF